VVAAVLNLILPQEDEETVEVVDEPSYVEEVVDVESQEKE
jgi:hypothetical protein